MQITTQSQSSSLSTKLRSLNEFDVRTSNLLFDVRLQAVLRRLTDPLQTQAALAAPTKAMHRLRIECDEGVFECVVNAPGNPSLAMAAAPDLNMRLRALASQAVLGPVVDQLQRLGLAGVQAMPIEVVWPNELSESSIWCVLKNQNGQIATFTLTQLAGGVSDVLRSRLSAFSGARHGRRDFALSGTVVLGTRIIALDVLRSLAVGDVVITPWQAKPQGGLLAKVYWGAQSGRRLAASCRVSDAYLKIEGEPRMKDDAETGQSDLSEDKLDTLGELDIPVRFEVETVSVPLSDLEAIQPGYVIELTAPLEGASIRLVAFGQTIGYAELVAVGGKLGARIIKMVARDEHLQSS
jgi:type III secretion protein Q